MHAVGDNREDEKNPQLEWLALLQSARQHWVAHKAACPDFRILQGNEGKKDKDNPSSAFVHYNAFKAEVANLISQHPVVGIPVPAAATLESGSGKGSDWQYILHLVFQPKALFDQFMEVTGILA